MGTLELGPMIARRLGGLVSLALVVLLGGCGASQKQRTPTASDVPLVPGAKIAVQARACDKAGSHAYCAIDLVVVNRHYTSSDVLAKDESDVLRQHGWSPSDGDTGLQSAANSPGHKFRLTYATATGDLRSIDLGYIGRPWPITYALANTMFDRTAAMSMMLEVGAS
jgi:hypothetical protein